MSGDRERRTCKRCQCARRVIWLTLGSVAVEIIDDIVVLMRIVISQ